MIKIQKPRLKHNVKPMLRTVYRMVPVPKINPIENPECYYSVKDMTSKMIVPSHLMGKMKPQYAKKLNKVK